MSCAEPVYKQLAPLQAGVGGFGVKDKKSQICWHRPVVIGRMSRELRGREEILAEGEWTMGVRGQKVEV